MYPLGGAGIGAQGADLTEFSTDPRPHRSLSGTAVPMSCTRVVMNQIVMPSECDALGICIGGQVCTSFVSQHRDHEMCFLMTVSGHLTSIVPKDPHTPIFLLHPPKVLSWIDVCAGMSAKSLARGPCVTASLDSVHFLRYV